MSSKDNFPRLDPGESTLPRKRFLNLLMEANVYEQATNLMPPEPPLPHPEPAQPPNEPLISWLPGWFTPQPPLFGAAAGSSAGCAIGSFQPKYKIDDNLSKRELKTSEKKSGR